jgi:GTP-binding protein
MFLDEVTIFVKAGSGGDGAATFRREAFVPRGGPDGGDGGRGGSVYLEVDPGLATLRDFQYRHHFRAESGGRGERQRRHGKAGQDLVLRVPPGTAVYDAATGALIADLVAAGQRVLVARGGRGGLGNVHFATATHQAPRHAQKGEPGEERTLRLELRLIADIGLVGLPNAGKSTLLAALTAARPKIAPYPFTTLEPNLGVLELGEDDPRRPTIADLPGLIEGASSGAGLGHTFLRHVERTRLLVHVVDGAGRDPEWAYGVIRDELAAYDPALLRRPMVVAFNKIDQAEAVAAWPAFRAARQREGVPVVAISAAVGTGLAELRRRLAELLPPAEVLAGPPEPAGVVVHRPEPVGEAFVVERESDGGFRVRGRRIERLTAMTDFENEESAARFQRDLERLGIDAELRRRGVEPGDVVRIGRLELIWEPDVGPEAAVASAGRRPRTGGPPRSGAGAGGEEATGRGVAGSAGDGRRKQPTRRAGGLHAGRVERGDGGR